MTLLKYMERSYFVSSSLTATSLMSVFTIFMDFSLDLYHLWIWMQNKYVFGIFEIPLFFPHFCIYLLLNMIQYLCGGLRSLVRWSGKMTAHNFFASESCMLVTRFMHQKTTLSVMLFVSLTQFIILFPIDSQFLLIDIIIDQNYTFSFWICVCTYSFSCHIISNSFSDGLIEKRELFIKG